MKFVRRARKNIQQRKMKKSMDELNANLAKVEMRVFRKKKMEIDRRRRMLGLPDPVPEDVRRGRMNPELYRVECRLHAEAGLPRPAPYQGYRQDLEESHRRHEHRIGFVSLHSIRRAVLSRNRQGQAHE